MDVQSDMESDQINESISILVKRQRYLSTILGFSRSKSELIDVLDTPRSTTDRAIRELASAGFVKRTTGGYQATSFGELCFRSFVRLRSELSGLYYAKELIEDASDVTRLSTTVFQNADIVLATKHTPDAPIQYIHQLLPKASAIRVLSPIVLNNSVQHYYDLLLKTNLHAEFIIPKSCLQTLIASYSHQLSTLLQLDNVCVRELSHCPPFGLFLFDSMSQYHVGILLLNDRGICGLVLTKHRAAVQWANRIYNQYQAQTDPISNFFASD